ncbi:hypothetical protein ZOSMA_110G00340 [Zostera marina]|uniref:BHLH domain-containing protein n=1 Tax=Zostera marina TaxID=29655 RepID=A0A0K9Q374_ZOSMR|nr:hypothetical protein ZOSMA_110G00340 [Zostera marina]
MHDFHDRACVPPVDQFYYNAGNEPTTNAFADEPNGSLNFSAAQPEFFHVGSNMNPEGLSMTIQSVTARQRRRKISNKTKELEKLIPGEHRMTTGEMLLSMAKYIKFLQAEVGMLCLMKQQNQSHNPTQRRIQQLVMSTDVQEKLYRANKCIVSKQIVDNLRNDPFFFSHTSSISRDFVMFMKSLKPPSPPPPPPTSI